MIDNSSTEPHSLLNSNKFTYKHNIDKVATNKKTNSRTKTTNKPLKDCYIKGEMRPVRIKIDKKTNELTLY